mmetsp:Transcript_44982/g.130125  ORF Transcript_44982/g.130125 Transcript_44982/m.130125 type:complete len:337 (-) Transcript_44982:737-1747(-)
MACVSADSVGHGRQGVLREAMGSTRRHVRARAQVGVAAAALGAGARHAELVGRQDVDQVLPLAAVRAQRRQALRRHDVEDGGVGLPRDGERPREDHREGHQAGRDGAQEDLDDLEDRLRLPVVVGRVRAPCSTEGLRRDVPGGLKDRICDGHRDGHRELQRDGEKAGVDALSPLAGPQLVILDDVRKHAVGYQVGYRQACTDYDAQDHGKEAALSQIDARHSAAEHRAADEVHLPLADAYSEKNPERRSNQGGTLHAQHEESNEVCVAQNILAEHQKVCLNEKHSCGAAEVNRDHTPKGPVGKHGFHLLADAQVLTSFLLRREFLPDAMEDCPGED